VRIGLHTGPVVIADDGEVFGETANVAAHVQAVAAPDTVVITPATQRLVAGLFVVEDRGPQMLKGVREPVTLYRVVQPSGVRSRLAVAAGRLTRFVGREVELATLVERWARAQDGAGQTVVVLGEPGVGKSRLVYQFHEHLTAVPHAWLEGGTTPYTEGTPFHPVIALVAQGLTFATGDTMAEQLSKLESGLGALASPEGVALLAAFLGLPPPTPLQMSPELQRRKTIDLLIQWTLSLSAAQPLVVVVEDLHWCDASTLELLGHLIAQSATARVLLLATARPEFTPPWPARSNLTTVQLPRLTTHEACDMVTALGGPELAAATRDALVARADGVPLYVEELTKAVAAPGAARSVAAIPATLADSLMARLDRLSAAKEVAQRAAVLGREFGYPLLAATAGLDEAALRHGLTRLIDAEILFARGAPPAATYTFKHALIQETAYHSLLKRTRQQLHARVAQALDERFPERVAAEPEVVARHADAAGLVATAVTYYQRAGERAQERSAHEEAITQFRKAIALVETLPAGPERDAREADVQMALGTTLGAARGYAHAETEAAYQRTRALCEAAGDSARLAWALLVLSMVYLNRGELDRSNMLTERVLAMSEETRDPSLMFRAHNNAALPKHYQGRFAASLAHCERVLALYDPAREREPHGYGNPPDLEALGVAAFNLWYLGHADQSLGRAREAVTLARTSGVPMRLAWALFHETMVHLLRRDWRAQRERAAEVIAIGDVRGFELWRGAGRIYHGLARVMAGEGPAALAEVAEGFALAAGTSHRLGAPGSVAALADGRRAAGKYAAALGTVESGFAVATETGQHFYDAGLLHLKGELLLDTDPASSAEAEAFFHRALDIARAQEAKSFELRAATSLARLWQRRGKLAEARALLAPVYAWFTEGFDTGDLVEAKALLAELG
jgi:predicted ATPase